MNPPDSAANSLNSDGKVAEAAVGGSAVSWAAVDWGTSNLRVWIMSADNQVLHSLQSDAGMGRLAATEFEGALLKLITPYLGEQPLAVLCCGMVGARQGWCDAGYIDTPVDPGNTVQVHTVDTVEPGIRVMILPGVKQMEPADVMRGEETQIAGALRNTPNYSGALCLPGTHTKWVHIKAGVITQFQTCMSGELFSLLSSESVLRHSLQHEGWSDSEFEQTVMNTLDKPETLARQLFTIRADNLVHGMHSQTLRARLSGLLIGAELAATRQYWSAQDVGIIGDQFIAGLYERALTQAGAQTHRIEASDATLTGLMAQYAALNR